MTRRALDDTPGGDRYMWHLGGGHVTVEASRCLFNGPDAKWPIGYTVASAASSEGHNVVIPNSPCYVVREVADLSFTDSAETCDALNEGIVNPGKIIDAAVEFASKFVEPQHESKMVVATVEGRSTVVVWAVRSVGPDPKESKP